MLLCLKMHLPCLGSDTQVCCAVLLSCRSGQPGSWCSCLCTVLAFKRISAWKTLLHPGALVYRLWARDGLWVGLARPHQRPSCMLPPAFLWYLLPHWLLSVLPQAAVVVSSCESTAQCSASQPTWNQHTLPCRKVHCKTIWWILINSLSSWQGFWGGGEKVLCILCTFKCCVTD